MGISVFLTACFESSTKYPYIKGLKEYMHTVHKTKIDTIKNRVLYFLPVSECISCQSTELNLTMLSESRIKNMSLILIGQESNSRFTNLINNLGGIKFIDKESRINYYETGILKPLLLHIKNGKVYYFLNVTDYQIEKAKKYFRDNEL